MSDSPKYYNIPYTKWRPGQLEAIKAIKSADSRVILLQARTGIGKSGIGAGLGARGESVRLLTFTRSLQKQYGDDMPDTEVLYGLNAYPCELIPGNFYTANHCQYPNEMKKCPVSHKCEYLIQRDLTKDAVRQALSYQYFLKATWPYTDPTDYTYCDEAHSIPSVIMDHMTMEISPSELARHKIDPIPHLPPVDGVMKKRLASWLMDVADQAKEIAGLINSKSFKSHRDVALRSWYNTFEDKARTISVGITEEPDMFYVSGDPVSGMKIFPLTPAPFFWKLFGSQNKLIMASATIGNPKQFVRLMGIGNDYLYHEVPPLYPPSGEPVYYYKDAPRMSYRSGDKAIRKQADLIMDIDGNFGKNQHGLVHCSSKDAAYTMARELSKRTRKDVWVTPDNMTTEKKLEAWKTKMGKSSGLITVAFSFHTGVDAPEVAWNVIQKVPYIPLDEYGQQILKSNKRLYGWGAAVKIEQATGRIRRGKPEHYEQDGKPTRKMVAVLDNNFLRLKNYYSEHFKKCLIGVS